MAYTRNDVEAWADCMARNFAAAGMTSDDIVQQAHGYGLFTGGLGYHYGHPQPDRAHSPAAAGTERTLAHRGGRKKGAAQPEGGSGAQTRI